MKIGMEKGRRLLQIEDFDLTAEAMEKKRKKFLEYLDIRHEELKKWLSDRGMLPQKESKKNG